MILRLAVLATLAAAGTEVIPSDKSDIKVNTNVWFVVIGQDCGGDWIKFNDMCYLVRDQRKFWGEGRKDCQSMNADLAVSNTPEIHEFLNNLLGDTGVRYWIGLHDTTMEGNFVWVDGSPLTSTFWSGGEPNNYGEYEEDCVEYSPEKGKWWDENCIEPQYYICGRSINQVIQCDESNGWKPYNGKCYKYLDDRKTFVDSEYFCNLIDGNLVAVNSQDEQNFLQSYQVTIELDYWIGLTDKDSGSTFPGDFSWTDGSSYGPTTYQNWDSGEPDFVNQANCVGVPRLTGGKWAVGNCGDTKTFFCERLEGTCPEGWRQHDGQCYQFNVNNQMTWTDAKHYCEAQGTYMVTILSDSENQFITSKLPQMRNEGVNDVYIGISDVINDGQFAWTTGNAVSYNHWNDGMPQNTQDQYDCGSMFTGDLSGRWDTRTCFNLQGFICKVQVGRQVSPVPPDMTIGTCPAGWTLFGDSCYYVSLDDSSTWTGSQTSCEGLNANLVSIHGADEQSFLTNRASILGENLWIGLHDTMGEGNFVWTDGSPLDFTSWNAGEPNNMDNGEDCVHLNGAYQNAGTWNDLPCDRQHRFICKKPKDDDGTVNTPIPAPTGIYNDKCGLEWEYDGNSDIYSGSCYLFRFNDYKFWDDALYQCRLEGGDLTSVSGYEEQLFLQDRTQYTNEGALWFGANDMSAEGGWEWTDMTPFRYINWNDGEPNNANDDGEHCGEWYTATGKWNDISCRREVGYICKQGRNIQKYSYPHRLRRFEDSSNYRKTYTAIFPDLCASYCKFEREFACLSFDYERNTRKCMLSDTSMRNAPLVPTTESDNPVDHYELDPDTPIELPPTTANPGHGCPNGWRDYGGYCYYINTAQVEYDDARTLCTTQGADLASINSANENNFILSYMYDAGFDASRCWIGMNDLDQEMLYSWTDGSEVTYVNWAYYEPNNSGNEDCVEMYVNDGRWNDLPCTGWYFNPVCKQKKSASGTIPEVTGCPAGWTAYQSSCYWFNTNALTWSDAKQDCQSQGAHLVVINDRYENGYVSAQLGLQTLKFSFWTGLNDIAKPGTYEWVDGSPITFTNWAVGQPSDAFGNCVIADAGVSSSGYWFNFNCDDTHAYVCEQLRDGYTTSAPNNPGKTNPSNINCAPGWIGYGNGCFRIYETDDNNLRKTWDGARSFCVASGGDLASFHSEAEEVYIRDSYDALDPDNAYGYWIGLNDRAVEGGYEWSDGSPVEYTNWEPGEPNDYGGIEECVESFLNPGRAWNDLDCNAPRHWICRIPKGVVPVSPSPITAEQCPDDPNWTYRHPYCYYVSPATGENRKSWQVAENYCQDNGGNLLSIHDSDEQGYINALTTMVVSSYWIGLREYQQDGELTWSDGTPLDYTNWNPGEPNDANGEEQCAETETFDEGRWNDNACGIKNAFICKRPYDNTAPITRLPTASPVGGCPTGWYKLLNKCYRIYGYDGDDRKNWRDARDVCQSIAGGNLATIHNQAQQSSLSAMIKGVPDSDVWIGLSDIGSQGKFHWSDETDLDYTNWANGQPDGSVLFPQPGNVDCVEMINDGDRPGGWNDVECESTMNAFLCQIPLDPALPDNPQSINVCTSETYTAYFDSCFRVLTSPVGFNEAEAKCEADGATLASVYDGYEQAFIETQMYANDLTSVWIGMSDDGSGQYRWLDGWPVLYTNWGNNEPTMRDGEGCVMVRNAAWEDTQCETAKPFVCKISTDGECCVMVRNAARRTHYVKQLNHLYAKYLLVCDIHDVMQEGDGRVINNEPTMRDGEGCVMVRNAAWKDTQCETAKPFVCKISTAEPPQTPEPPKGYCPEGWLAFDTKCFHFEYGSDARVSWSDAQRICQENYGGQLTSIHSAAENKFIQTNSLTNGYGVRSLWIGLIRNDAGGWDWADGTPVDFVYWENGEPNGLGGGENCAEMYDERYGKWNDEDCLSGAGYVCSLKQLPYPPGEEPSAQTGGITAGAIIGILIALLVVIVACVLVGWFVINRSSSKSFDTTTSVTTGSVGFDNSLYGKTDDKAQIVTDA
ncbi:macrophage mannose receptor 1-like [Amphiura filiformis]|uniref:macrophage mannose receptor 1-like n=1 Tax=Amphiura filiformis TaxID=82378 RepID=UPI003B22229F